MSETNLGEPTIWERLGRAGEVLRLSLARGVSVPAYLIEGTDEDAVRDVAFEVAALLVSTRAPGSQLDPGEHAALAARVRGGHHSDVHHVTRDKATVISVSALDTHLARAQQSAREGPRQVFLIDPADALEPQGIARYLKTLEEPPGPTAFLLLTPRPERLPLAVKSRCQSIVVPPLGRETLCALLEAEGMAPTDAQRLSRWAAGSKSRAQQLIDTSLDQALDAFFSALRSGGVQTAVAPLDAAVRAAKAEAHPSVLVGEILRIAGLEARDAMVGRSALLPRATPAAATALFARIGDLAAAAAVHVTPHAVLTELASAVKPCC